MRFSIPLVFIIAIALSSCESEPEQPWWRTQEYIDDSTFVQSQLAWFDTIYNNLPEYAEIKETDCQPGGFSNFFLFNNDKPFLIFEKEDLNHNAYYISYFWYKKEQKDMQVETPFFKWKPGEYAYEDIQDLAGQIRRVQSEKYFVVYYNDTNKYIEPKLDTTAEYFEPGYMSGYAVIVDYTTGKQVCAFKVEAENSEEVDYSTMFADMGPGMEVFTQRAPRTGIIVDLWHNMATSVQNVLSDQRTKK